jgi:DNA-binding IclR family transcriptional regulator
MDAPNFSKPVAEGTPPDAERKYRAPALEKGLDILELMARNGAPMTLTQISLALDRSVSELFRMVQALEFKGYIEMSSTGEGYALTNRLFALGMAQAPTKTLLEAALPVMRRLSKVSMQSCHLGVPSDDQMVVVARIEAPGDMGFSVRIGYRRPIVDATSGVIIFAFQPEPIRSSWLERLAAHASKARIDAFLARAEEVRAQGYARSQSDFVQGVIDVSAPVVGAYRVVAALTVPFVHRLPPPCTVAETITLVREAAAEISAELQTDD